MNTIFLSHTTFKQHKSCDNLNSLNIHDSIRNYTKGSNFVEVSQNIFSNPQSPIVNNIEHYRNIYGSPENFIKRQFNYEKMKVFDEKFRKEIERRESFNNFPTDLNHLIIPLAKSGFYYIGNKADPDKVKCIFCQGILYKWNKNDVPERDHKKSYPTCPFLLNLNVGNVPIEENGEKFLSNDPDLNYGDKILYNVVSTFDNISLLLPNQLEFDLEVREKTFEKFEHLKELCLEGLYVIEKETMNYLKCYECDHEIQILKNIEKLSHDVFHNKNCSFLKLIKSNLYYENIFKNSSSNECENAKMRNYCKVEYCVTDEEIEARVDSRKTNKIENLNHDRNKLKPLLERKIKETGKDYESTYEFLSDLNKSKETKHELYEDNSQLEFIFSNSFCVVCLDKQVSVVFLPCGHLKTCNHCSRLLSSCPVCRQIIEKRVYGISFG